VAVVPVFVSSTFRDFHGERDLLAGPVRERLNEAVRDLGCRVELIDLRWGVDTVGVDEEEAARRVVDVCLAEVARAKPLFLGLIGRRVGYIPDPVHARWVADRAGVPAQERVEGLSVTELELGFGMLWPSAPAGEHIVMLRELDGQAPQGWVDPDTARVEALRTWAAETAAKLGVWVVEYRAGVHEGVIDFDLVTVRDTNARDVSVSFEDLVVDLLAGPVRRRADTLAASESSGRSGAERLFRDDHRLSVGRDAQITDVLERVCDGGRVVLAGASGVGKSTVVCAVEDGLRAKGVMVISVLLGATANGGTRRDLAMALAEQLEQALGHRVDPPKDVSEEDFTVWWRDVLSEALTVAGSLVLVVDALDTLSGDRAAEDLWPLLVAPPAMRMLCSTTLPAQVSALAGVGVDAVRMSALPGPIAAQAAAMWAAESGRTLPASVVQVIATQARAPLWVRLAVDLISDLDGEDFAAIAAAADQAGAIEGLLLAEARELPSQVEGLASLFLDRVAQRIGEAQAGLLLGALAASHSGLASESLTHLLTAEPSAAMNVAALRRVLGDQLRATDAAGRLTFAHAVIRAAAATCAPHDVHDRIVRVLDDEVWDRTDVLDAIWHSVVATGLADRTAVTVRARVLARALNHHLDDSPVVFMQAIDAQLTGIDLIDTLADSGLTAAGLSTLNTVFDVDARYVMAPDRVELAEKILDLCRTTAEPSAPSRSVLRATQNFGDTLATSGKLGAAADAYTESVTLARELVDRQTGTLQPLQDLSHALNSLGRVAMAGGELAGAGRAYSELVTIARELVARQPGTLQPLQDLSDALNSLGRVAMAGGELAGAGRAYSELVTIARELVARQPGILQPLRALSSALAYVGEAAEAGGDLAAAHRAYADCVEILRGLEDNTPSRPLTDVGPREVDSDLIEAVEITREVVARQPGNLGPLEALSAALIAVGQSATAGGDLAVADRTFTELVTIARELVARQPGNLQSLRNLSNALFNVGAVAKQGRDLAAADRAYTEWVAIARELVARQPGNVQPLRDLSDALFVVGRRAEDGGRDLAGADRAFTEWVAIARELVARQPGNLEPVRDLSEALNNAGRVAEASADLAGADRAFTESVTITRELVARQPDNLRPLRDLNAALDNVGRVAEASADLASAHRAYTESVTITRELVARGRTDLVANDPTALGPLQDLVVALNNVGRVAEASADLAGADRAYTESVAIHRDLVARQPGNLEPLRDLVVALDNVGRVAEAGADLAGAHRAYAESVETAFRLLERQPQGDRAVRDAVYLLGRLAAVCDSLGYSRDAAEFRRQATNIDRRADLRD
jgi:tetratricopeptide (TPR) repeat protein